MQDDDEFKDDGSVWTSYSDLFTTVAVIFLVMFVFALIKASVTKMQSVSEKKSHEEELRGKISPKEKKKIDKQVAKVNESINEIQKYEDLVNKKMIEMNTFVQELKGNKKLMKNLMKDQQKKETLLALVSHKLEETDSSLKKENIRNINLSKEIEAKLKKISTLNEQQEKLKNRLASMSEDIKKKNLKIKDVILDKEKIKRQLSEETEKYNIKVNVSDSRQKKIMKLESELNLSQVKLKVTSVKLKTSREDHRAKQVSNDREVKAQLFEITNLKKEITSSQVNVKKLRENIQQKNKINQEEIKKIKLLERSNKQALVKITRLEKSFEAKEQQYTSEQARNDRLVKSSVELKEKTRSLSSTLSEKGKLAKNLTKQLERVRSKLTALGKTSGRQKQKISKLNSAYETGKSELQKTKFQLGSSNENIKALKGQLKSVGSRNGELQKQSDTLRKGREGLTVKNLQLRGENTLFEKEISGLRKENSSLQGANNKYRNLNAKLSGDMRKQKSNFEKNLNEKNKVCHALESKSKSNIKALKRENIASLGKIHSCQKESEVSKKKISLLNGELDGSKSKLSKNAGDFRRQLSKLKGKNKNLKSLLRNFAKRVTSVKGKLRGNIAKQLAKEFANANLNVQVDGETGNVVLLMNENFRFKKNSFHLSRVAKKTLTKIIPIYSKVLFGSKRIQDKIQSFNVVGHASPSYKREFIEPLADNNVAYAYNMRLSAQRASSITNYIFGREVGQYDFKKKLKSFTKAVGQGFTKPVVSLPQSRSLASTQKNTCGPYNCHASQRVELSFTLKDDEKSLNKLINMAQEVNE